MRIRRWTSRVIEFTVKSSKKVQLNQLEWVRVLTCGIPWYLYCRSKEELFLLVDWRCYMRRSINQRSSPFDVQACNQQFCLPKIEQISIQHYVSSITWRLYGFSPPKYQNSLFKVAQQPSLAAVPSPYSKAKFSLILPEQRINTLKNAWYLPSKSTMKGLFFEL